jgi:hypothetical protein
MPRSFMARAIAAWPLIPCVQTVQLQRQPVHRTVHPFPVAPVLQQRRQDPKPAR